MFLFKSKTDETRLRYVDKYQQVFEINIIIKITFEDNYHKGIIIIKYNTLYTLTVKNYQKLTYKTF